MKSDLKFIMVCISCLAIFNVAMARRKKSPRRNRTSKKLKSEVFHADYNETVVSTTTEVPIHFPYGMVCASRKAHRSVALRATEECCHRIGVPCKQTDHIGQPSERNCVINRHREWKNMKLCCKKKKKSWKKGHVEDGIDCNHKLENVTEITTTELSPPSTASSPEPTTAEITTTTTSTTTPTTSKPHPKTTKHHPKTLRPHPETSRPHKDHPKTTTAHPITTTATTTTTTTRRPTTTTTKKPERKKDKLRKALKLT